MEVQQRLRSEEITELSTQSKRAVRQGGLDLQNFRGYSSLKAVNSAPSEPNTEMPDLTGTCDAMFGQRLIDHGAYPNDVYDIQPQNWDEILGMMEQPSLLFHKNLIMCSIEHSSGQWRRF